MLLLLITTLAVTVTVVIHYFGSKGPMQHYQSELLEAHCCTLNHAHLLYSMLNMLFHSTFS